MFRHCRRFLFPIVYKSSDPRNNVMSTPLGNGVLCSPASWCHVPMNNATRGVTGGALLDGHSRYMRRRQLEVNILRFHYSSHLAPKQRQRRNSAEQERRWEAAGRVHRHFALCGRTAMPHLLELYGALVLRNWERVFLELRVKWVTNTRLEFPWFVKWGDWNAT